MVQYVKESYEELTNHVTWPNISDAQKEMVVVVVFSILFSLVIWGMDSSFEYLIGKYFEFIIFLILILRDAHYPHFIDETTRISHSLTCIILHQERHRHLINLCGMNE